MALFTVELCTCDQHSLLRGHSSHKEWQVTWFRHVHKQKYPAINLCETMDIMHGIPYFVSGNSFNEIGPDKMIFTLRELSTLPQGDIKHQAGHS